MDSSDVGPGHWQMNPFDYPDLFSQKITRHSSSCWLCNSSKVSPQRFGGANACWIKTGNAIWMMAEKDPGNHISLFIFV